MDHGMTLCDAGIVVFADTALTGEYLQRDELRPLHQQMRQLVDSQLAPVSLSVEPVVPAFDVSASSHGGRTRTPRTRRRSVSKLPQSQLPS